MDAGNQELQCGIVCVSEKNEVPVKNDQKTNTAFEASNICLFWWALWWGTVGIGLINAICDNLSRSQITEANVMEKQKNSKRLLYEF